MSNDLVHGTFTIERTYPAAPGRVFAAFANPELKARWFVGPDGWQLVKREQEFRPGGIEVVHGRFPDGKESLFIAHYHYIVENERIVYAYDMHVSGALLSISLTTIDLRSERGQTRLVFTEQGVFFGTEEDIRQREQGSAWLLDKVGASLSTS